MALLLEILQIPQTLQVSNMILFDGDILLYKAGFSVESRTISGIRVAEPIGHAIHNLNSIISKSLKALDTVEYRIFISGPSMTNYRYKVAKTKPYKGNRSPEDKPIHYEKLKEYIKHNHPTTVSSIGEADDELGKALSIDHNNIVVSIDKDLLMVPGLHYNPDKKQLYLATDPGELFIEITKAGKKVLRGGGFKWFCAQMLLGDPVDNIPGLKGYGPVKTLTKLNKCTTIRSMWARVIREYRVTGSIDRIDEIRQLLWIQRGTPFKGVIKK